MGVRWGKRDEPTNALQWKDGWTVVRVRNAKKLVQNKTEETKVGFQ